MLELATDDEARKQGCYFDAERADRVCYFFERFLCHSKGQWAGQPFELLPWQREDVIRPLFGWVRFDGTRRFRIAHVEVPKKNGKSAISSGIALYLLCADGEPGAQVFCCAADRKQAGIVFRECMDMVRQSPDLKRRLAVFRGTSTITYEANGSFLRAESAEAYTKEGLNIHGLIFDELHAQKTRDLWDTLRYGGAARRQPLIFAITTAGWDRTTICWEQHEYAEKVASGEVQDIAFFPYIRAADPDDDWQSEKTWRKANPSYGVTISASDFEQAAAEAASSPRKENSFKRYRLNLWTQQADRWITQASWEACGIGDDDPVAWREDAIERLSGHSCFGGLDLGSTSDLTALALLFDDEEAHGGVTVLPWFWCPADGVPKKDPQFRAMYDAWAKDGFMRKTPGDVADYDVIRREINELADRFGIVDLAVDRLFQGAQLCSQLMEDGLEVTAFGQGFLSMAAPSKAFEELVLRGAIQHGNNPILTWMSSNATIKEDAAGNMKPVKPPRQSQAKIDGVVATIMAVGLWQSGTKEEGSVYDTMEPEWI